MCGDVGVAKKVNMVTKTKKKKVDIRCPVCGGHTVRHGFNTTKSGKWARRKCQECGTTFYEDKKSSKMEVKK